MSIVYKEIPRTGFDKRVDCYICDWCKEKYDNNDNGDTCFDVNEFKFEHRIGTT